MNSIENNIQCTYENNAVLPFLDALVSRTDEDFSTSMYIFCIARLMGTIFIFFLLSSFQQTDVKETDFRNSVIFCYIALKFPNAFNVPLWIKVHA